MTNLIATIVVCIVTNVTTTDNSIFVPDFGGTWISTQDCGASTSLPLNGLWQGQQNTHANLQGHMSEPTERTETTEIVEVKRLSFKWEGKDWNGEVKKVLSSSSRKFKLKKSETWEEVQE